MNSQIFHKIRLLLFSPESKFELFIRSLYHRVAATRMYFRIQNWLSKRSYTRWLAKQQDRFLPPLESFTNQSKVTFILDGSHTSIEDMNRTLVSIQAINGNAWEILLITPEYSTSNQIIQGSKSNGKISIVNNQSNLLSVVSGEYVIFCQAGDQFSKQLLTRFYQTLKQDSTPDVVYYDSRVNDERSRRDKPFFKPSMLSPALLLSLNYLTRGFISIDALREVLSKVDPKMNLLSQEYDCILRLCEKSAKFKHLPFLLVSQTQNITSGDQIYQEVVKNYLARKGLCDVSYTNEKERTQVKWKTKPISVSIVILTKNHVELLRSMINSIFSHTYSQEINLKIIDNNTKDNEALTYYEEIKKNPLIQIIPYNQPFNYSEAINLGAANSESDLILFLNDDMRIFNSDWLSELAQWAIRPEIGVVGAKLIRANRTIQHAGIIMGLTGFMGHIYLNAPEHYFGLWGSVDWYRDVLALTGACQMVRRDVFNQVGGYDDNYRLAFGDIDFCIRVNELGYRNIYNPNSVLFHYEGRSRGYETPVEDTLYGYENLGKYLLKDDPNFSPNLSYSRIPRCNYELDSEDERIQQFEERKKFFIDTK